MTYHNLEKTLLEYVENSDNPEINFWLGVQYENLNQTASAISLYLRCAERSNDKELQYESLIRSGLCFRKQGDRLISQKSCWQNAIYTLSNRPEAYMFMSQVFASQDQHHTALSFLCAGEVFAENEKSLKPLRVSLSKDYGGLFEFKTKKVMWFRKCGIDHLPEDLQFMNSIEITQQ